MLIYHTFALLALLPLAFANPTSKNNYKDSKSCKSTEFYYSPKSCCLPHGGPVRKSPPPPKKQCPSSGWYWHEQSDCCVPSHPPPPSPPPPQCQKDWSWSAESQCCVHKSTSCKSNEFYYPPKSCCLPHGGPPAPPPPPPQKQCPPSSWYWSHETSCCVPNHPPPPPSSPRPPPQCNKNWDWNQDTQCCEPHHYPAPPPQPSGVAHHHNGGKNYRHKRLSQRSRESSLCPQGLSACPFTNPFTTSQSVNKSGSDYECLDTFTELTSCGGCASTGEGENCGSIEGSWNVGCEAGRCKIYTCAAGFQKSLNGLSCVSL